MSNPFVIMPIDIIEIILDPFLFPYTHGNIFLTNIFSFFAVDKYNNKLLKILVISKRFWFWSRIKKYFFDGDRQLFPFLGKCCITQIVDLDKLEMLKILPNLTFLIMELPKYPKNIFELLPKNLVCACLHSPMSSRHPKKERNKKINFDLTHLSSFLSLVELHFPESFNQKIPDNLPKTIKIINFGDNFNQSFENLTHLPNLETIFLGHKFSQKIKLQEIPKSAKEIHVDNQEKDGSITTRQILKVEDGHRWCNVLFFER